ncbi:MAG TPA: protein kinase [Verrucomicrobiae bacterium]|nr:protein kinase [Verrucomicrobiae bacterium]
MDNTRQEEALFEAARNLTDPVARQAFLDKACGNNPALRARIETLLESEKNADHFFAEAAPIRPPKSSSEAPVTEAVGSRIGPYKLLQQIGEGGAGVVYMAEQETPVRRRVALKIIKLGMDTKSVIARFDAERQALAMMDHPNIARVLDAGSTETGRPYFVMELVRGVKITEYCDRNNLDTRERLNLLIQVCHAVQHAHQKGIIHRDLKPSNILVTLHDGVPVPKVIDFGIAKATERRLTDRTLFTAYDEVIGTPAYMSPEQAEMSGLDVDTRSDIYSLGVLLYELLTGKTPFDPKELVKSGLDQMRRTLREEEPRRPSTMLTTMQKAELNTTASHRHEEAPKLISLVKGDLDWIVMKALEKDRTRRYETTNGLAMDIQRYLGNEPVVARPPSRIYRFQKLVRRNKIIFASAGAVALALIAGFSTSTWLFFREREARQRAVEAERQQDRLRREAEAGQKITQATVLINAERFTDAEKLLSEVTLDKPTVEGATVLRALGEWHALQGEWPQAAKQFTALLKINDLDGADTGTLDYLECGPALIESGNAEGYEHFRNGIAARFANTTSPFTDRIIKISLLLPPSDSFLRSYLPALENAEQSLSVDVTNDVFLAAWRSVSLALVQYRLGEFSKAAESARRCLSYPEYNAPRSATAQVILAMADWRLHRQDEARAEIAQARDLIESKFSVGLDRGTGVQGFWFDWVFAQILCREAETLMK